ncbi:ketopantoate reductase family protein, partial [Staphylococcus arlettae]
YWEAHVKSINTHGMDIKTETENYTVDIPAILAQDVATEFDLIIILTKAMQSEAMLKHLLAAGCIHKDTAIMSMMNGLGHEERLSQIVPLSQIYLAVTMWTAGLRGPGQLLLEGEGTIHLQRADGKMDSHTNTILQILNKAGLN